MVAATKTTWLLLAASSVQAATIFNTQGIPYPTIRHTAWEALDSTSQVIAEDFLDCKYWKVLFWEEMPKTGSVATFTTKHHRLSKYFID